MKKMIMILSFIAVLGSCNTPQPTTTTDTGTSTQPTTSTNTGSTRDTTGRTDTTQRRDTLIRQ